MFKYIFIISNIFYSIKKEIINLLIFTYGNISNIFFTYKIYFNKFVFYENMFFFNVVNPYELLSISYFLLPILNPQSIIKVIIIAYILLIS